MSLVIAETSTSTWHYHLRQVQERLYLGGGAPPALCGQQLGWDTQIPLRAWGIRGHLPESWCQKCETAAKVLGFSFGPQVTVVSRPRSQPDREEE